MVDSVIGAGMRVKFYMTILWDLTTINISRFYDNEKTIIGRKVIEKYHTLLGLGKAGCYVCETNLIADGHNRPMSPLKGFLIYITVATTTACQPGFINERAAIFDGKQVALRISKEVSIAFQVNIEIRKQMSVWHDPEYEHIGFISKHSKCSSMYPYSVDKISICPNIELESSEVTTLQNEEQKHMFLSWFGDPKNESTRTVNICWDHYFAALSRKNDAAAVENNILLFILALSVLSF